MSKTTRVVFCGWRPSRISRTTSSLYRSVASSSDGTGLRALQIEEHPPRILEALGSKRGLRVHLDRDAHAVRDRRPLDVTNQHRRGASVDATLASAAVALVPIAF